ncbi:sensor histidine kinase [Paenibacillus sp. LHD-38]|nr:sensor histidine kinase [Paenibacillus sp. LHD-38]MDQ8733680.1 sensor histidine kinase [Paenibacillus sp. LHD-38]
MILLVVSLAVAGGLLVFLCYRHLRRSKQLRYIHSKLSEWNNGQTSEKLLLFSADRALQPLLIEINRLIENNRNTETHHVKHEQSMRKMLTNMSHDMKTPLTVVLGLTETVATDHTLHEQERKRLLTKVHGKAMEMVAMLNKFFDLAKLESEDQHVPLTKINMNLFCENIILFFYDTITSKGLEVDIAIPEQTIFALGNKDALERICSNLISNAIRYGSEGNAIGFSLSADAEKVNIEVWDRGRGISEHDQLHIFERLYTLEDSRNTEYQGSGLGLTITKRLVEKLGGDINVKSTPFKKTVFTVTLNKLNY